MKRKLLSILAAVAVILSGAVAIAPAAEAKLPCPGGVGANTCKVIAVASTSQAGVYFQDVPAFGQAQQGFYVNPGDANYVGHPANAPGALIFAGWCMWREIYSIQTGKWLASKLDRNPYGPTKFVYQQWDEFNRIIMVPCST